MRFLYKAKNNKGEMVTGTVRASTQYDAEKILMNHNLIAVDIAVEQKPVFNFGFGKRITTKDKAVFSRQLATMISAGLPLTKAITIITTQARTDRLRGIYITIFKDLEEGSSFSHALSRHPEMFDKVYVSVINSGETTGKLETVLTQLAKQLENDNNFAGKIKGIMYYPAFILIALLGIGGYMLVVVVPQLKLIFEEAGATLPLATRMLLVLSAVMESYWYLVVIGLIVFAGIVKFWLASDSGVRAINYLQLSIPGIKTLAEGIYISRFARIMEMLIKAGVPLLDALRIGASVMKNETYEDGILGTIKRIEKGVPLSTELLKNPVFPQFLGQMVAVGEETGQLDQVLGKVAEYYEEEVSARVKGLSTLIEPVILVIMGIGVAFLVFAILMPIYNISQIQ